MTTDGGARGMNIREHIEAGHYPLDGKGRALVPVGCDCVATICATDAPGAQPIIGFIKGPGAHDTCSLICWHDDGVHTRPRGAWTDLLPPPPRKVKVSATLRGGGQHEGDEVLRSMRREDNDDVPPAGVRIELTGEYEEPWS